MSYTGTDKPQLIMKDGTRTSGRTLTDIRDLKITCGVLKQANGSALIEWGNNRIIAAVYGPKEVFPKHMTDPYKAVVNARYVMTPFCSLEEHGRAGPNRRSIEISKVAKHVFENTILTNQFPKTQIDIHMEVLQSDGGTRIAAITAASVALVDAGIPVKDLVCGVAVGKIDGKLAVDIDKIEDNYGESDAAIVISPRTGDVLLMQLEGILTPDEVRQSVKLAQEASLKVREKQAAALAEKYALLDVENGNEQ